MLRFTARKQSPNFIELALCGIQNFKFSVGPAPPPPKSPRREIDIRKLASARLPSPLSIGMNDQFKFCAVTVGEAMPAA
jgi:hypothetical protein